MPRYFFAILLSLFASTEFALANNCDLTQYRWDCSMPVAAKSSHAAPSLVYCNHAPVYISRENYDRLTRYQRAYVRMNVLVDGEYFEAHCVPAARN